MRIVSKRSCCRETLATCRLSLRQSPQSQPLGVELVEWVKSDNFRTEKIHHLSSASVYSGYQELFSEKDYNSATNSKNMNSKQFLEKFVINLSREKETEVINYRISNVYGLGMRQGFINESINNLKNGQPITIYKEIDLIRDYLLIDDLISGLIDLRLNDSSGEVLNLSTGCGMAISEIITHLQSLGINDMKLIEIATPENTVPRSVLSCKKLEEIVTWKPQIIGKTLHRLVQELV